MSDPQVLVSWAAADNEPDIMGDTALLTNASIPQRVLAFGSWLEPDKAQAMERATDALRANGESFAMPLVTLNGRAIEATAAHRRTRRAAAARRQRHQARSGRAPRPPRQNPERHGIAPRLDRGAAVSGLTRDIAGTLTYVNHRLCPRRRGPRSGRCADSGVGAAQPAGARGSPAAPAPREASMPAGSPPIVAGSRRSFDVIDVPTAAAALASASTRPKPNRCATS